MEETTRIPQATIKTVCSKTQYPGSCKDLFNANPRTPGATKEEFAVIGISFMYEFSQDGVTKFTRAIESAGGNYQLKNAATSCLKNYNDIVAKSRIALFSSAAGNYSRITQFSESEKLAYDCESLMPSKYLAIEDVTQTMIFRCDIAQKANNYMLGPHRIFSVCPLPRGCTIERFWVEPVGSWV
ncbi:hypothetical protein ACFE04_010442 [Oxalis oulophora]